MKNGEQKKREEERKKKRRRQDSNLCGETPMDFESIALTTRPRRQLQVRAIYNNHKPSAFQGRSQVTNVSWTCLKMLLKKMSPGKYTIITTSMWHTVGGRGRTRKMLNPREITFEKALCLVPRGLKGNRVYIQSMTVYYYYIGQSEEYVIRILWRSKKINWFFQQSILMASSSVKFSSTKFPKNM